MHPTKRTPGPEPERLKIGVDFEAATDQIVKVPRPADGWPDAKKKSKKAKKKRS